MQAIPPTYAPPRPPTEGKPLTNRQKIVLAVTIIVVVLAVALSYVVGLATILIVAGALGLFYLIVLRKRWVGRHGISREVDLSL